MRCTAPKQGGRSVNGSSNYFVSSLISFSTALTRRRHDADSQHCRAAQLELLRETACGPQTFGRRRGPGAPLRLEALTGAASRSLSDSEGRFETESLSRVRIMPISASPVLSLPLLWHRMECFPLVTRKRPYDAPARMFPNATASSPRHWRILTPGERERPLRRRVPLSAEFRASPRLLSAFLPTVPAWYHEVSRLAAATVMSVLSMLERRMLQNV